MKTAENAVSRVLSESQSKISALLGQLPVRVLPPPLALLTAGLRSVGSPRSSPVIELEDDLANPPVPDLAAPSAGPSPD